MKKDFNQILFNTAYGMCCFLALMGAVDYIKLSEGIRSILYGIAILYFGIVILNDKFKLKRLFVTLFLMCISIYSYLELKSVYLFIDVLALCAIRNVNIKKVAMTDLIIKVIFYIIHFSLYIIDYFFDYKNLITNIFIGDDGRIRHSLFFSHPNIAAAIFWGIVIDIYFLRKKWNILDWFIISFFVGLIYFFTQTRTLLLSYALLIIFELFRNKKIMISQISFLYKYIFEFFTIITIAMGILYNSGNNFLIGILNPLTSGRVYSIAYAFKEFGITVMSRDITLDLLVLDNFYIRTLTIFGIVYLIPLFYMTKFKNDNMDKNVIIIIIFAIILFSEFNGIIIGNSIALMLLANNFWEYKKQISLKKE